MPYGYEARVEAEKACERLSTIRGNTTNKFVVAPYQSLEDGTVLTWGIEHWYKPYDEEDREWVLNGHMWTNRL